MTNKEIAVNNVEIKNDENTFKVEIKNEPETLIAAHNSNPEAHKNLIGKLIEKTQILSNIVNEIEDNIVLPSEIPTKLSNLENDMGFVSEETLIAALEKRNMVTLPQLNEKIEENKNELQNIININSNMVTNQIETLKNEFSEKIDPIKISSLVQQSTKYMVLKTTATLQSFTMPADGRLYIQGKSTVGGAWVRLARKTNTDVFTQGNIPLSGNYGTTSFFVKKDEIIEVSYYGCGQIILVFFYNNAWAQKTDESGEA